MIERCIGESEEGIYSTISIRGGSLRLPTYLPTYLPMIIHPPTIEQTLTAMSWGRVRLDHVFTVGAEMGVGEGLEVGLMWYKREREKE